MLLAVFNYRKVPKILVSGRMFLYIQIPITSFLLPCNSTLSEHFGAFRFTANWFFWKFLICKIRKYCKLHAYKINCNDQQSKTFADPSTIGFYFIWFRINYPDKKKLFISLSMGWNNLWMTILVPMLLHTGIYTIAHLKVSK